MDLTGELHAIEVGAAGKRLSRSREDGAERAHADGSGQAIEPLCLRRKLRGEADGLVYALPDHGEESPAQVGVALGDRLGDSAAHLHGAIQRTAGPPQVSHQPRGEAEVEVARSHLAGQLPAQDWRGAAREQRASPEIGIELDVTEEVASTGRVDADVQQGSGGARFHVHVGSAERSEEHTSELQSPCNLVCRLLLEKKNIEMCL